MSVAEGLEEALRASLEDVGGAGPPPPASKSAVQALQKEALTVERLREVGGADGECCVCRCAEAHASPPLGPPALC